MICHELTRIGLSERALVVGSKMHDFNFISGLSQSELTVMHSGKDDSLNHMLAGGNGFPQSNWLTMQVAFDAGCTIERRDLRSMLAWSRDLGQCLADRKKGTVQ